MLVALGIYPNLTYDLPQQIPLLGEGSGPERRAGVVVQFVVVGLSEISPLPKDHESYKN